MYHKHVSIRSIAIIALILVVGCAQQAPKSTASSAEPVVELETSEGTIVLQLDKAAAPRTVNNFLGYVDDGFYDGTVFHRVIPGFVIQAGGFTQEAVKKQTRPALVMEQTGLNNERATIAMARTSDPDSATSQFYINLKDNAMLDPTPNGPGYAVFGEVIKGMDVVERIAAADTGTRTVTDPLTGRTSPLGDWPAEDIVIMTARIR